MALQPNTQKYISPFIEAQFPRFYNEFGPVFIRFVESYYEWMETVGPLYDSRHIDEYLDIDTTVERFIVYFKNKYLPNIQLSTSTNIKMLVKHSLDIYRSRGTVRAIDLLFRLVFGVGAQVYYPWNDTFRLSAGEWYVPQYIEVSTQDDLDKFVGKEIIGVSSGAIGFVESWVRKTKDSKIIDVLYISALFGKFKTNEFINVRKTPFAIETCPTIIGSLNYVSVGGTIINSRVGERLKVVGEKGYGGECIVSGVENRSGLVSFDLTDGGYGYTSNAQILISEKVLFLDNINVGNNASEGNIFKLFDTVYQPTANILYDTANGNFQNNDVIFAYTNNVVTGTGLVLAYRNDSSSTGEMAIYVSNGSFSPNTIIFNTGNTISANLFSYTDTTATANIIGESLTFQGDIEQIHGNFSTKEKISLNSNTTATLNYIAVRDSIGTFYAQDRIGPWTSNTTVTGQFSNASAKLTNIMMTVGVVSVSNNFVIDTRAPVKTTLSGTTARLQRISTGSSANVSFGNNLNHREIVNLNTDFINDYANVELGATAYGFPKDPSANVSSYLEDALTYTDLNIGHITSLSFTAPGQNYDVAPFVRILEPMIFSSKIPALGDLKFSNASASFMLNEVVSQASSNAKGIVVGIKNNTLTIEKLSYVNKFESNSSFIGESSGAVAHLDVVFNATQTKYASDLGGTYMGMNGRIIPEVVTTNGNITDVKVSVSGWGYEQNEPVTLVNENGNVVATGQTLLLTQGTGRGFYRTKDGFLSDIKKLHDSDYRQVSSYEVRSPITFDRYQDMLKEILHVAGTKAFGAFYYHNISNLNIDVGSNVRKTVYGANTIGAINGFANVFGVGGFTIDLTANATSFANVSGVGGYTLDLIATANGSANVSAISNYIFGAVGEIAGNTSVAAVGEVPPISVVGGATGNANVQGIGASTVMFVGSASGNSTVNIISEVNSIGTGFGGSNTNGISG